MERNTLAQENLLSKNKLKKTPKKPFSNEKVNNLYLRSIR